MTAKCFRTGSPLLALLLWVPAAVAQTASVPPHDARVRLALDSIRAWQPWTLQQQVELTEIEAPPFKEARRAEEFRRRLVAMGYQNARIDAEGNVIAELGGSGSGPLIVISGHLDTVFPEGTDVQVRRAGNRLLAPGIADDGRGLAVVLTVARAFQVAQVQSLATILFVGTVGEEGQGDLRGVRHLFGKELVDRIDYFISVDGTGFGIISGAVGSNRYRITYHGPGGHSYGSFGMPNPMHAMGRAIAAIAELQVPSDPKTTFSVGVVSGGTSVNSIPMEATFDLDMRSEDPAALAELDRQARGALDDALAAEKARWPRSNEALELRIDTIGIRPAGSQPDSAPIVGAAEAAARALGLRTALIASSTDANIPISMGIPALTIDGGGRGGGSHALDEWYEDTPDSYKGPQWAALLVAMLAGLR
jgi:acetylornithine deacetylase/succinyl-diaminopimelate desuccinylase-like protein